MKIIPLLAYSAMSVQRSQQEASETRPFKRSPLLHKLLRFRGDVCVREGETLVRKMPDGQPTVERRCRE